MTNKPYPSPLFFLRVFAPLRETFFGFLCIAIILLIVSQTSLAAKPNAIPIAYELKVHPASIAITNRRRPHSILVTGKAADGRTIDLTSQAVYKSADEKIAVIDSSLTVTISHLDLSEYRIRYRWPH